MIFSTTVDRLTLLKAASWRNPSQTEIYIILINDETVFLQLYLNVIK
jgi:hypothetical protein